MLAPHQDPTRGYLAVLGHSLQLQGVVTCFPLVLRSYRMGWVSITLTELVVRARTAGCRVKDGPWVWICIVGGCVCGERWWTLLCFSVGGEGWFGGGYCLLSFFSLPVFLMYFSSATIQFVISIASLRFMLFQPMALARICLCAECALQ